MSEGTLNEFERELLARLELDGLPLMILGHGVDDDELQRLQTTTIKLLKCSLIKVYAEVHEPDLPIQEGEVVLSNRNNWQRQEESAEVRIYMIATTTP